MKIRLLVVAAFLALSSCVVNQKVEPIRVDQTNYLFDENQNGTLEPDEYKKFKRFMDLHLITTDIIDTNHDGVNSDEEINRAVEYLKKQKLEVSELMLALLKIPGIEITIIKSGSESKQ